MGKEEREPKTYHGHCSRTQLSDSTHAFFLHACFDIICNHVSRKIEHLLGVFFHLLQKRRVRTGQETGMDEIQPLDGSRIHYGLHP